MNQPVLSNEGKVSCWRKQLGLLMGLELTTDRSIINEEYQSLGAKPANCVHVFLVKCISYVNTFQRSWRR